LSKARVQELLRREPVPDAAAAEERAWQVISTAYAERIPAPPAGRGWRLAVVLAGATILAALLLSPAGAAVRDWIHDVVTGEGDAAPALTSLPASGELLVESELGPWIVQEDGSKRLIGAYGDAAFSPHGRYLAVADGRELAAVVADADAVGQPAGTPHWTIDAPQHVSDPAWAPSGVRVAYRSGEQLRAVSGDGKGDRAIAGPIASVSPVWKPLSAHEEACVDAATGIASCAANVLAWVDAGRRVHIVDTDSGRSLLRHAVEPFPGEITDLAWSPDGHRLVVLGNEFAVVLRPDGSFATKLLAGGVAAAYSPKGDRVAVVERQYRPGGVHSVVSLVTNGAAGSPLKRLYGGPGQLTDLTWSPDGRWLLVGYPGADQWVFIPVGHGGHLHAVAGIGDEFDAGGGTSGRFPRVSGWIDG
jgi:Tol biopolymer transport system component